MSSASSETKLPRISVITPSFNQGRYLEKTINSVLEQQYPNLEYIIIDGCSTDNSLEIVKKYERHLKYWVSEPDRGQSHAINKGFEHATGDLLAWLNSDDYYMQDSLRKVADLFLERPDAGAFVGAGQMVDNKGRTIYHKNPEDVTFNALFRWPIEGLFMQPSCFFTKNTWLKCGPLDESLQFTMDVDLWLKIAKHSKYARCNDLLSSTLIHNEAKTTEFRYRTMVDLAIVMMRYGGEKEARQILEYMEKKLSYAEQNLRKIIDHPFVRVVKPMIKLFMKPAARRA